MLLIILSYLGGVLTILSPCILPVLPFVFARSSEPFRRSGLPLLLGMALTFAGVATLAAVGGGWVVQANQYGRWVAIVLMAFFGVTLLFPHLADRLTRPLVSMGDRLSNSAREAEGSSSVKSSFLLGIATGLLWAPCAGPILGLVLTGAALHGASVGTTLLLLAYAAGAATSLALALLVGGKLFTAMKRSLGAGEWVRRGLGAAMLCGVAAIALGLDTGLLTKVSTVATAGIEQKLLDTLAPAAPQNTPVVAAAPEAGGAMMKAALKGSAAEPMSLPVEGTLPDLSGAVKWLNSPPLSAEQLKGKVVLIDFWTYSCINCLRALPYVNAWSKKYHDQGLVVIGVHAPEFAFERDANNVQKAVHDLGINYPVALDNDYAIWRGFNNQYWPAHYFIDAKGQIRHHHFGEGEYAESEKVIQQLLLEAGNTNVSKDVVTANAQGVMQSADNAEMNSPETYLGYDRAENFASPGDQISDKSHAYQPPKQPELNQWGLDGKWTAKPEQVTLDQANGRIVYRFHARDLHLVLGPGAEGKPVHFKVSIDGAAPGDSHGSDIAADGSGMVTEQRLYQLVRQAGPVTDHTFTIEFMDPGVQAYAFTFG
ncbi:cytochrome c biogenesis protein DipZ [Pseudomonas sp. NA-150]|uniref:cytochrome c biogenesis protein DipZ n=1 Tax=Pseudomonas sp. NA-150 TaxID=3367525 RepID=UPI0037C7C093